MAKVKVPKRVGGVKVPKKVRKQVKKALNFADSPGVRELAVAGLGLAAEALIDRAQSREIARTGGKEAPEDGDSGRQASAGKLNGSLDALNLGEVLRAAAVEGARRFLEGYEEGRSNARARGDAGRRRKKAEGERAEA